jgi:hypothetical protein
VTVLSVRREDQSLGRTSYHHMWNSVQLHLTRHPEMPLSKFIFIPRHSFLWTPLHVLTLLNRSSIRSDSFTPSNAFIDTFKSPCRISSLIADVRRTELSCLPFPHLVVVYCDVLVLSHCVAAARNLCLIVSRSSESPLFATQPAF